MAANSDTSDYLKQKIYTISHPGISHEEIVDGYQNWCKTYDKLLSGRHRGLISSIYTIYKHGSKERQKGSHQKKKRTRSPSLEPPPPQLEPAEVEDRPPFNEPPQLHPSDTEDIERDVDRDSSISRSEASDDGASSAKTTGTDLVEEGYSAPRNAALTASRYFDGDERKDVKVLDVGAGTGLVGDELQQLGFRQIDALDALKCMLDVAREKGVYKNYYEEYLSATEPSSIPKDTYDCVTASSTFGDFHIPCECLNELIRVVKPGGLIFISTKKVDIEYLRNFNAYVEKLVGEGSIEEIDRVTHPLYLAGSEGICYVFRVL